MLAEVIAPDIQAIAGDTQFWWNWWVNVAIAIGTIATVVVALFGQALRLKLFPPRLKLLLANPEGERTPVLITWRDEKGEPRERTESARYYHVRVVNERRLSPATNVQVFLIGMEERGPDGQLQVTWTGDVPMRWRHQEVFPPVRTVGSRQIAIFSILLRGNG